MLTNYECVATLQCASGTQSENYVRCVTMLNCGRLVTGGNDRTLKVFTRGQQTKTLTGHGDYVTCVVPLADGVLSGSHDETLKRWDVIDGRCLQTIATGANISCVTVLDGGRVVCLFLWDDTMKVFSLADGRCIHTLTGNERFKSVAALPGGRMAAVNYASLMIWDVSAGSLVQSLTNPEESITCVVALRDGRVLTGSDYGTLRIWDLAAGSCVLTLNAQFVDRLRCLTVLSDDRIVAGTENGKLQVFELAGDRGRRLQTLLCRRNEDPEGLDPIPSVAPMRDGQFASVHLFQRSLKIWIDPQRIAEKRMAKELGRKKAVPDVASVIAAFV